MKVPTLLSKILGNVEKVDATQVANFEALTKEFVEYQANAEGVVAEYTAEVEKLTLTVTALTLKAEALQSQLDEALAEKRAEAEAQASAKQAARKALIVTAIGEDKAEGLLAATADMEDAQFNTVLAALGVSAAVEAKSPMFEEIGASVDADVPPTTGESAEMKLLKQKYPQSR